MIVPSVLERILLSGKYLGTREEPLTCPNSLNDIQTMKWFIRVAWCEL